MILANMHAQYYFDTEKKDSTHGSLTYADSVIPLGFSYPGATDKESRPRQRAQRPVPLMERPVSQFGTGPFLAATAGVVAVGVLCLSPFLWAGDPVDVLRDRCEAGDGEACHQLALWYRDGRSAPQDAQEAFRFAWRACHVGTGQTCFSTCLEGFNTCAMTGNSDPVLWDQMRRLLAEKNPERRRQIIMGTTDVRVFNELRQDPPYAELAALADLAVLRDAMYTRAAELAQSDPHRGIRSAMIENGLLEREVLEGMASKDPDPDERKMARQRLALFLPPEYMAKQAVMDPDAQVRLRMVEGLEDPSQLARIAEKDTAPLVRTAAILRMAELGHADQRLLARIAERDADDHVRAAAAAHLTDQKVLAHVARTSPSGGARMNAIRGLTDDQATLAWVAEHDPDGDNRLEATGRVTDQRVLARIARTSADLFAQGEAISRLTDAGILADLAKMAADPDVRQLAAERLKKLQVVP